MRVALPLLSIFAASAAANTVPSPEYIFENPSADQLKNNEFHFPTVRESTVMARRMLRYENIGVLSTTFPNSTAHTMENRPSDVAGLAFGMMEYFGDCEPSTGNPTILAVDITSTYRNVLAGSNITLTMRWHPPHKTYMTPAMMPRFSLVGYLEDMSKDEIEKGKIAQCFSRYHPDSRIWQPGNDIHESHWVRLVVREVYWFGGFGDRARIQWIDREMWQNITEAEIESIRLPGEPSTEASSGVWGAVQKIFGKMEL